MLRFSYSCYIQRRWRKPHNISDISMFIQHLFEVVINVTNNLGKHIIVHMGTKQPTFSGAEALEGEDLEKLLSFNSRLLDCQTST